MIDQFQDWEDFFERVGDDHLHPTKYGEPLWHPTVEQMYQAFRARFLDELLGASMARGFDDLSSLLAGIKYQPRAADNEGER